ncbi:unnamed protein product [Bemisia tabaci]|uniref:Uncharacterized protein n=1 Tax=Bemisia tabaci TaxID=7038 RepID=A0A9P0F9K1_BEMTA|nr:unnamed protein product [Bemisia tabaci]
MCRVWFCSACGQSLPDGLRCMSLFGAWLLILVGAATTIAMAIQQGSYYLLLIAFAVSALGYIFTYGGIRVCSPLLILVGTLIHFLLLFLIPFAIYLLLKPEIDKMKSGSKDAPFKGTPGAILLGIGIANAVYWLWEFYYTLTASSAFALLNRQSCPPCSPCPPVRGTC